MIITVAIVVVVLFLMWLIMRAPRLWYWKTKDKVNALKSIENRLDHIEGKGEIYRIDNSKPIPCKEIDDIQDIAIKIKDENIDLLKPKLNENEKFVGKSGKIYTRKELEAKIKK
jgi:signal-transduction protein with cAMP-binding, CBS, and nucleotidyltransferase domain